MISSLVDVSALSGTDGISSVLQNTLKSKESNNTDFAAVLKDAISSSLKDTQSLIDSSEEAKIDFALGNADNTHDLQIAQQKALMAVNYTVAVRDRFLDAYREIMQMQV